MSESTSNIPAVRPIPRNGEPAPDGYHYEAVPEGGWRLTEGKRCRAGAGYHKAACGAPAVAELLRPPTYRTTPVGRWWAYCSQHMYGRWVEGGQVLHWVLREGADRG